MSDPSDEPTARVGGNQKDEPTLVLPQSDSASSQLPDFSPGFILGGRYRIVSLLGRGGIGEVYRADDLKLGQPVALKFLSEKLRASSVAREALYREARAGREVTHPNVCRLYDISEADRHLFLSMEYVDGEDLASLLRRIGRFSADKALAVIRDVCAGLSAAHEKGVVHADLKPANIMLDGRGRARISDFGLAALVVDSAQRGVIAGTPRYMAPEQFSGTPASVQSDIYALGLVMAEVFTGQRVILGSTLGEIVEQQRAATDLSLSGVVPGIDPAIDALVRECLRFEPSERPRSVESILERLPARDALAAAVAAGETPSPRMVIEAAETGEVSRAVAWSALLLAIGGTLLVAFLARHSMLYERQPLQPPEVLESRARELLKRVAPDVTVRDTASWIEVDGRAEEFLVEGVSTEAAPLKEGRLLFHYRTSPTALGASNTEFRVTDDDPPFDRSGMVRVVVDESGRLNELAVIPPQHDPFAKVKDDGAWIAPLIRDAGLDPAHLKTAPSEWAAPGDSDAKWAWLETAAESKAARRLEAASFHGKPVWFAVIAPWTAADRMTQRQVSTPNAVATTINVLFLISIPMVLIFLALRNVRRGQGDLRGATRLALLVMVSSFVTSLLRADHSLTFRTEWLAASLMVAHAAFFGGIVWIGYVAVEPLVRRRWPRMMIGWTRLLAGRWRDPMIGREALAGVCMAIVVLLAWHASVLVPQWLGQKSAALNYAVTPLGSLRHVAFFLCRAIGESILRAIGAAAVLLLFRVITRQRIVAAVLTVGILLLSFLGDTTAPLIFRFGYAAIGGCVVLLLLTRFGMLSVAVTAYVIIVMRALPVTLDLSKWYFARGSLAMCAAILLALFGFIVSLGEKSVFAGEMLD